MDRVKGDREEARCGMGRKKEVSLEMATAALEFWRLLRGTLGAENPLRGEQATHPIDQYNHLGSVHSLEMPLGHISSCPCLPGARGQPYDDILAFQGRHDHLPLVGSQLHSGNGRALRPLALLAPSRA